MWPCVGPAGILQTHPTSSSSFRFTPERYYTATPPRLPASLLLGGTVFRCELSRVHCKGWSRVFGDESGIFFYLGHLLDLLGSKSSKSYLWKAFKYFQSQTRLGPRLEQETDTRNETHSSMKPHSSPFHASTRQSQDTTRVLDSVWSNTVRL